MTKETQKEIKRMRTLKRKLPNEIRIEVRAIRVERPNYVGASPTMTVCYSLHEGGIKFNSPKDLLWDVANTEMEIKAGCLIHSVLKECRELILKGSPAKT